MSKNLTRKGLALGAAVALGSTLFAGAPAFAANEVVFAPASGTTYAMISGETLTVQASLGATISSSSYDKIKYQVTNAAGLSLTTALTLTGSSGDTDLSANTMTTAQVVRSTGGTVSANTSTLALSVAATDEGTVTVQPWIDSDGDNVIDADTEFSAPAQTVTFVKLANVTFSTVLTQPVLGDTKLAATVTTDKSINLDQIKTSVKVGFATKATNYTAVTGNTVVDNAGAFTNGESTTFVSASNSLTSEVSQAPAATTYYVAQALFDPAGAAAIAEAGSESVKATAAATISSLDKLKAAVSADVAVDSSTSAMTVRNGTASVKLSAQAYSTGTTKAAAGQTVKVTITEGSATGNTDAATFTAGGKTLKDTTSAADKIEFDVVTDADGKVSFDLAIAGTVSGTDDITVALSAQGQSSSNTISFDDATVANGALVNSSVIGASAIQKVAAGGSYTLKFTAKDSFGKGLGSNHRVLLTETGATPDVVREATLANGVVTFALTDSTSVTESYNAQLQKWNATTLAWESGNYTLISAYAPTVGTSAAVDKVATLVGTATTGLALNLNELKAADTRVGDAAPTVTSGTVATVSGTVVDALAVGTYSDVTLSGTGVMFEANGVYTVGSITVQSDANGAFGGVKVYSNTAGDTVITATAAGKTKTLTLTFASAAAGTGSTYVIDAPATIAPGKTLTMNVVVKDKYGNKVADAIEFTYAGPGLPLSSTTPTAANTEYKVLLGAADAATATVTVKIDKNADGDKTDDGETLTASIKIEAPAAPAAPEVKTTIVGVTKAIRVRVENAKGEEVEVVVNGRTVAVAIAGTNSKLWVLKSTKGKKSVKVYVDGDLVAVKTVTVK